MFSYCMYLLMTQEGFLSPSPFKISIAKPAGRFYCHQITKCGDRGCGNRYKTSTPVPCHIVSLLD